MAFTQTDLDALDAARKQGRGESAFRIASSNSIPWTTT